MKISLSWLKNYVPILESAQEIAQLLTQSGLEVVSITPSEPIEGSLNGLLVGQVITCENHPNADRLKLTLVDIGQDTALRIVCGAPNVQVGQKVVVAPVGTTIRNQTGTSLKLKKANIRGEISEGMLCAEDEIGLSPTHDGIIVLHTSLPPGTPAIQYFNGQSDQILEVDLTPNRADACSHLGIARELGAILGRSLCYPSVKSVQKINLNAQILPIQVDVLDDSACPRYSCITISGVKIGPSPPWLRDRLKAIGLNPINNIVDVTNFVMHELGQPLHAFDYDQIVGKKITVKQLGQEADFVTLEGTSKKLNGTELMVCDQLGAISMAGIVGGQRAGIHSNTQNIFLESAYFLPGLIRMAAKQHAIKTDASFRYERGTDPNLTVYALERAYLLIQEVAPGAIASEFIDGYPEEIKNVNIEMRYNHIKKLLGKTIPKSTIKKILTRLAIRVTHENPAGFLASVPPYRVDVTREVDVIEEIARIYGYHRIEGKENLGSTYLAPQSQPSHHKLWNEVATLLANNGYHEIYTNSLTKSCYTELIDSAHKQQHIALCNPLSEALNVLRQTLLFGGLEAILHNLNRKQTDIKFFERGKVYYQSGQQYMEKDRLGIWLTGNMEAVTWLKKPQAAVFHDLNAVLYKVLHKLGITEFVCEPFQSGLYQTGIQVLLHQKQLLTAGEVNQKLLSCTNIGQSVFFADIDWDVLLSNWLPLRRYREFSKFPLVKRDISLVLDKSVSFESVKKVIAQQHNNLIQNFFIFDVYEGGKLGHEKKAYGLRFVLQGQEKTLDEKTIDQVVQRLESAFKSQLGAVIRL